LSRHGARDPTKGQDKLLRATIAKIQANTTQYSKRVAFIKNFTYNLGVDQLVPFGQQELKNSGIKFYQRYESLAKRNTIFVRSSGEARVVESAQNFTQGFCSHNVSNPSCTTDGFSPLPILVISEDDGTNNTLNHGLCTAFESKKKNGGIGAQATSNFTNVFAPPITARLNTQLVGANLTNDDTVNLMNICTFATVAEETANPLSPFCNLFTTSEWKSFNYLASITKFYNFGPGNPLGPTQGVGFTNELIARLTDSAVVDHTSTNQTLDSSSATFPLGLKLYADFSHDNDMISIMSAMGLFNNTAFLSTTQEDDSSSFLASELVPFSSRVYVEKLACDGESEEMVRVLVNDRVMPMTNCGSNAKGMCTLSNFVAGLGFARAGGLWDQC